MAKSELTPEARRRLWQCYQLLLKLAEETEKVASVKAHCAKKRTAQNSISAEEMFVSRIKTNKRTMGQKPEENVDKD